MDVGQSLPLHRLLQDSRVGHGRGERQNGPELYVPQARDHGEDPKPRRVQTCGEDELIHGNGATRPGWNEGLFRVVLTRARAPSLRLRSFLAPLRLCGRYSEYTASRYSNHV